MVIRHAVSEDTATSLKTTTEVAFNPKVFLNQLCKVHRQCGWILNSLDCHWIDADPHLPAPLLAKMHPKGEPDLDSLAPGLLSNLREIQGLIPGLPLPGWLTLLANDFEKAVEHRDEDTPIDYQDVEWRARIFKLGHGLHHFLICLRGFTYEANCLRNVINAKRSTLREERATIAKLYEGVCALYQS